MLEWWRRMAEMTQAPDLRYTGQHQKTSSWWCRRAEMPQHHPCQTRVALRCLNDFQASTKSSARSFTSWLSSVSLYLHNFFSSTATWILYVKFPPWSILCVPVHLYIPRGSWVWPVLGCPQNSTSYCRKCCNIAENAVVLFVSHCQELELYVVRTAHINSSEPLVLTLRCSCLVMFFSPFRIRWYLQGRQEMAPESLFSLNLFLHIVDRLVLPSPTLWKISKPIDSKGKLEEWQRWEKSPREDWF